MSDKARRETPQVATRAVLLVALGSLGFVAASLLALRIYYAWSVQSPIVRPPRAFPAPQLQTDPDGDLRRLEAAQRRSLTGYAWVDRERGLVRIPIDRAMDLIAARGANAYAPLDAPAPVSAGAASAAAARARP